MEHVGCLAWVLVLAVFHDLVSGFLVEHVGCLAWALLWQFSMVLYQVFSWNVLDVWCGFCGDSIPWFCIRSSCGTCWLFGMGFIVAVFHGFVSGLIMEHVLCFAQSLTLCVQNK